MKTRKYVACRRDNRRREIVYCASEPTFETHGQEYAYFIGPFRTLQGAKFMRDYGQGNPHCQTVADAERLAKRGMVLWGKHQAHGGVLLKIAAGTSRELQYELRQRESEGWNELTICPSAT